MGIGIESTLYIKDFFVQVVTRVEVQVLSKEDTWAIRLLNFITGARQLQSEGLTRELPV
jgi:exonuclease V